MRKKITVFLLVVILLANAGFARKEQKSNSADIAELAQNAMGKGGNTEEKTRRLVSWINTNFNWSYTDYQKRTVEEIIQRRARNCAELANVLALLLQKNNVSFRWIHEINIQPKSERRQEDAAKLVVQKGNSYSVFGFQHNDHVWLEVFDEKSNSWFPADPAVGVVGVNEWVAARMAFTARRQPQVPAVAKVVRDMIVPVVVVFDRRTGKPLENRSEFYLIEGFNKFYRNKLNKLPSWNDWKMIDARFSPIASGALAGEANLHEQGKLIEQIALEYEKLKAEAVVQKISPKSLK